MLDIGIIIPELQKYGGAERVLIECMRRWQRRHRLTLYSTNTNLGLLAEAGIDAVTCRPLSPPFDGDHAVLLNSTLLPKIWEGEVGQHDIYHTHLWPTHLLNLHPMVWYPHEPLRLVNDLLYSLGSEGEDSLEIEHFLHFYPRQTYDRVSEAHYESVLRTISTFDQTGRPDRIVANSRYTAKSLEAIYGTPVRDVVYPGVTVGDFVGGAGAQDIVLAVGQLWRHKRMRLIIEAMFHVEGLKLCIVGSGPEKPGLQSAAERIGVADRVEFLSGLSNREVQALFARCLCTVFMPVREPFGIVALESLAAGKPLVAVNEGGYTEIVDSKCAFLIPPEPVAIAQHIRRLQSDAQLARRMGEHGRRIAKRYSWDDTARKLLAIIEDTHRSWRARHPKRKQRVDRALVGAHYFTWYREGYGSAHWHDNATHGGVSDTPSIGYYDSINGDTVRHHLKLMTDAKLDFVCFNLHVDDGGLDNFQLWGATVMCRLARDMKLGLRFAVNLCLYTHDERAIERAMAVVRDEFLSSDAALQFNRKPVLFVFWTKAMNRDHRVLQTIRKLSDGAVRIALSAHGSDPRSEARSLAPLFDGYGLFSPLTVGPAAQWEASWQAAYDAGAAMPGRCRVMTLSPGYDDTPLQDPNRRNNPVRTVPRDEGAVYKRMIDFTLDQQKPPHMTLISTFNEFHENTHIEPTTTFGDAYLRQTARFIAALKRKARSGRKSLK
jgi:glycosyltransferase involved in cell wall biosynthesis